MPSRLATVEGRNFTFIEAISFIVFISVEMFPSAKLVCESGIIMFIFHFVMGDSRKLLVNLLNDRIIN